MHVPAWLRGKRRHMTVTAPSFAIEELLSQLGGLMIKTVVGRNRRGDRQLIEMQGREFGGDQVWGVPHITKPRFRGHGKLRRIVETWVEERALSMHRQVGHECIPMGDGAPSEPCMQVDARQAK